MDDDDHLIAEAEAYEQAQADAWIDEEDQRAEMVIENGEKLKNAVAAASEDNQQRREREDGWIVDEDVVLCGHCGGQVAADEFYKTFQVNVCYDCRGRSDSYKLITKVSVPSPNSAYYCTTYVFYHKLHSIEPSLNHPPPFLRGHSQGGLPPLR